MASSIRKTAVGRQGKAARAKRTQLKRTQGVLVASAASPSEASALVLGQLTACPVGWQNPLTPHSSSPTGQPALVAHGMAQVVGD